jgi:hypothetical protein
MRKSRHWPGRGEWKGRRKPHEHGATTSTARALVEPKFSRTEWSGLFGGGNSGGEER